MDENKVQIAEQESVQEEKESKTELKKEPGLWSGLFTKEEQSRWTS